MIKWTIEKIKKLFEDIASIAKSFSSIVASLVASVTAIFTGYKEIRKVIYSSRKQKTEVTQSSESVKTTTGSGHGTITGTIQPSGPISLEAKYEMDSNTIMFGVAVVILPLIWYIEKRKKKDVKS